MTRGHCALLLLLLGGPAAAAPSGADLLASCEHLLAGDFQGTESLICTWYVWPCHCAGDAEPQTPAVCLPRAAQTETLAREVVAGLRGHAELQAQAAPVAAASILSQFYPCP